MSAVGLTMLVTMLIGGAGDSSSTACMIKMVAVQATNEGRTATFFGSGLEGVRSALTSFNYDTYTRIASATTSLAVGRKTRLIINKHYTLVVEPVSQVEAGRIRVRARILMKSKSGKVVNALDSTLTMVLGKHLNLGGLRLPKGELILVLKAEAS